MQGLGSGNCIAMFMGGICPLVMALLGSALAIALAFICAQDSVALQLLVLPGPTEILSTYNWSTLLLHLLNVAILSPSAGSSLMRTAQRRQEYCCLVAIAKALSTRSLDTASLQLI